MLLAGAAGALLASTVAVTVALVPQRQMTVQLPSGGTEEIRYAGRTPQVAIYPNVVNGALRPAAFDGPAAICIRQIEISSTGEVTSRSLGVCANTLRDSMAAQGSAHQHV